MYLMQNPDPTEVVNPDDVRIKRVYTRRTGELAPDPVISRTDAAGIDIVVEWEAGSAANQYYAAAGPNDLEIEVLTYSLANSALGGAFVALMPPVGGSPRNPVNTDGENREGTYQAEFGLPAGHFPAADVYEITAILRGPRQAGATPFQAAFAKCLCYVY
jgi:hypothetical protein